MFGNKFSGDEIAREFHNKMSSLKKEATNKSAELSGEYFLEAPVESNSAGDSELSGQIDSMESRVEDAAVSEAVSIADDTVCKECEATDCKCCEKCGKVNCACYIENHAEDYYIDSNAEFVLHELGKMAGRLRLDKHAFAADMVEATAMSIKDDLVKEASQKMKVASGLEKMAIDMYNQGDNFSGDLLRATLEQIKKTNL
jgi:hypothetical protein